MKGWIKIHRQLLESEIFANQKALKIWIWLLLKASTQKRFVSLNIGNGFSEIELQIGELIFGRFKAEEILEIDGSTIYKWLKKMQELEMITVISNNKYSIITICNYEYYQLENNSKVTTEEQQSNSGVTTEEQQGNNRVTQYKNIKELEESKELLKSENILKTENKFEIGKDNLKKELEPFIKTYGKEMLNAFFRYWSEANQNKTKCRYQMEKTWETSKRLVTWNNNNKKFTDAK